MKQISKVALLLAALCQLTLAYEDLMVSASDDKEPIPSVNLGTVDPQKPEAYLVQLKPKSSSSASNSQSKFLLMLRLPDGRTETIGYNTESNSESLASSASSTAVTSDNTSEVEVDPSSSAIPTVDSSNHNSYAAAAAALQQQQQMDADIGFDEQQKDTQANIQDDSQQQDSQNKGNSNDAYENDQQHQSQVLADAQQNDEEQQQQQQKDESAYGQQKELDNNSPSHEVRYQSSGIEQKPDEQQNEQHHESNDAANVQQNEEPVTQVRDTNYNSNEERKVPVILIALPPSASPLSQSHRMMRKSNIDTLNALGINADADGSSRSGVNPQHPFPGGAFGGYGNSHTPSAAGGYGSVAMRLAAAGIAPPTEDDVANPSRLKSILAPIMRNNRNPYATTKGGNQVQLVQQVYSPSSAAIKGDANRVNQYSTGVTAHEAAIHGSSYRATAAALTAQAESAPTKGGNLVQYKYESPRGKTNEAVQGTKSPPAPTAAVKSAPVALVRTYSSQLGIGARMASVMQREYGQVHASPVAIAKSRARYAPSSPSSPSSVPSYSSTNVHSAVESDVNSSVGYDDEAADGLSSKVVSSYAPSSTSSTSTSASSLSSSSSVVSPSVSSSLSTPKVGGKQRMVLLLYNKGELDSTVTA